MEKNAKLQAIALFVLFCLISPNVWASETLSTTSSFNDSRQQITGTESETLRSADDLELGSEVGMYRNRQPSGSLLQSEGKASDLFGEGGYVHPFISLSEGYSDNIFNQNSGEETGFATIFSLGGWFAYPPSRIQLLALDTSSTTPGGLALEREKEVYFKRYQTYFLYQGDFLAYHDHKDANYNRHRAEGLFQYNLKGGLSFDFVDEYKKTQDPYSTGFSTQIDKYQTNLFDTTVSYDFSKLLSGGLGYSHFWVEYDDTANEGRNRNDNEFTVNLRIKALPKTTFTTEYRYLDIDYDKDVVSDSTMYYLSGGAEWAITPKTSLKIKPGYVYKNFSKSGIDSFDDLVFDISAVSNIRTNSSVRLSGSRKISETNTSSYDYILTQNVSLSYVHELTAKISANLFLSYLDEEYKDNKSVGSIAREREDDSYMFSPGLDYAVNDWLLLGLSYSYTDRDSNYSSYDYETNSFLLRATISL